MAAFGISIAQTLIEVVGCEIIKEICDMWGYKSQLLDLNKTVCTIKNVLLDAEKRELSHEALGYIEDLKAAVYDADDLFDEFLTLAEIKQLRMNRDGNKLFEKVRCFFSSKNQLGQAYRMSHKVKDIKQKLDAIADNHLKLGFRVDYKPIIRRGMETCSYVDAKGIVGREDDKEAIVNMLLDSSVQDFCFRSIVGVGGLGKTALAQLVYNDERIANEFPESLRLWVCVSDHDGEQFDARRILCKILELVTNRKFDGATTMEVVRKLFHERLSGQKYFLVLDDVWNEDRQNWLQLREFLMLGQEGSRILITTRSGITSAIIGENKDEHTYMLQGLSPENSWKLFEISAFSEGHEHENDSEFVETGMKIVEQCYNIPLAIKVVGSLLYGQDIKKWRHVEKTGLAKIKKDGNEVMSILKLSYYNLNPSLKNCFSYCAVFPKNFIIYKNMLVSLWMAQGFIQPLDGQSLEDAAEENFFILMRRCFFHYARLDEYGCVIFVKIHDLMHDVAQYVGEKEICGFGSNTSKIGDKTCHVSFVGDFGEQYANKTLGMAKLRSLIHLNDYHDIPAIQINVHHREYNKYVVTQVNKCTSLRVLELLDFGDNCSLKSIGKLIHLRYLNLYKNSFEVLPNSVTRLHNLQTLILAVCRNLRELPKDFSKLINLRHLDLRYCNNLVSMPSGMDKLTSLRMLPFFVVNEAQKKSTQKHYDGGLEALKALTNLEGNICIKIGKKYNTDIGGINYGEGYLRSMANLNEVEICFDDGCIDSEVVVKKMQPHKNLKGFILAGYKGATIASIAGDNWANYLPYLVKIELTFCEDLERMPKLSKLKHLKSLVLYSLAKLEYIEDSINSTSSDGEDSTTFFPSLEYLQISHLKSLKGWQRVKVSLVADDDHALMGLRFPRLLSLKVQWCNNLASFPGFHSLEALDFRGRSKLLGMIVNMRDQENNIPGTSSLRSFTFEGCDNLRSLSVLEHLTALESLDISGNEELIISENEDDDDDGSMPWKSLQQSLRFLAFKSLQNMSHLPKGVQYLTSLQSLQLSWCDTLEVLPEWIGCLSSLQSISIKYCGNLKSLPESMRKLTSLKRLEIGGCAELEERCKKPNGEDRPKIQHIPHIDISRWR